MAGGGERGDEGAVVSYVTSIAENDVIDWDKTHPSLVNI